MGDPTAAEVEVEAVRAAAEQRARLPRPRRGGGPRGSEADQFRAEADAAAEEMSAQLAAAQAGAAEAEIARFAAVADRDNVIEDVRREAAARIAAAESERKPQSGA